MDNQSENKDTVLTDKTPQTRSDIAQILDIDDKGLIYYLFRYEKETGESLYHTYSLSKKSGGKREIMSPIPPLKRMQRKLADYLNTIYFPKQNVYGFVQNRNTVNGAKHHVRAKVILNLDLHDFFGTINFGRVRGMLMNPPYCFGEKAATTVAQIACRNNKLPQGSPCSPVLANMICNYLDTALIRFAKKYHLMYTRYADDITFSTTQTLDEKVAYRDENKNACVADELERLIQKCGFKINKEKVFIQNISQRQLVTGIVVNKKVNVPREYASLTRSLLFRCKKDGIENAARYYLSKSGEYYRVPDKVREYSTAALIIWFRDVLVGRVSYIGSVKGKTDSVYLSLAKQCNQVFGFEVFKNIPKDIKIGKLVKGTLLVESQFGENRSQGSAFYIKDIGIITCYHCLQYTIEHDEVSYIYMINSDGYKQSLCKVVKKDILRSNKAKDFAVVEFVPQEPLLDYVEGHFNSNEDNLLKTVYLIGYPQFIEGDTVKVLDAHITSSKGAYIGASLYSVSCTIQHGMSGGPVLDDEYNVIGIIKGGLDTTDEELYEMETGFIPIRFATEDVILSVKP